MKTLKAQIKSTQLSGTQKNQTIDEKIKISSVPSAVPIVTKIEKTEILISDPVSTGTGVSTVENKIVIDLNSQQTDSIIIKNDDISLILEPEISPILFPEISLVLDPKIEEILITS